MTPDKGDYGDPLQKTSPSRARRELIISIIWPGTVAQRCSKCKHGHFLPSASCRARRHQGCPQYAPAIVGTPPQVRLRQRQPPQHQELVPARGQPPDWASLRPIWFHRQLISGWQEGRTAGARGSRG